MFCKKKLHFFIGRAAASLMRYFYDSTISKETKIKIARNYISCLHASGICFWYWLSSSLLTVLPFPIFPICVQIWSSLYYGLDMIHLFLNRKTKYDIVMIAHHFVSLLAILHLSDRSLYVFVLQNFFYVELSNFPLYYVYHCLAVKKKKNIWFLLVLILETLFFMYFRLYKCFLYDGQYIFVWLWKHSPFLVFLWVIVYVMSIAWTIKSAISVVTTATALLFKNS